MSSTSTKTKVKTNKKLSNKSGIYNRAETMFKKKCFIHHFIGEGLEEGEFVNALDNVKNLQEEYDMINNDDNKNKKRDNEKRESDYSIS